MPASAASILGLVVEELESGRSITTQRGRSWRLAARREGQLWVDSVEKISFEFHARKVRAEIEI